MTKSLCRIAEIAAYVLFVAARDPSSAIAQSDVRIEMEILTELPSSAGVADLNNRGVIVGSAPSETGEYQVPFRWTQQAGVELLIGDVQGTATAVNDAGAVIGWYIVGGNLFGFLWTPVLKFVDLGTFMPSAINNRGQIVGECDFIPGTWSPPCLWEHGKLTTLGAGWVPGDLNERGEVTGQALVDNQFVAITWSRQTGVTVLPHSAAPAVDGGFSLNNRGDIVGIDAPDAITNNPARWNRGGSLATIPLRGGALFSINESGWAIGRYEVEVAPFQFAWHGFVWGPDNQIVFFGPALPVAINNRDEILGTTELGGVTYAVIWRIRHGS